MWNFPPHNVSHLDTKGPKKDLKQNAIIKSENLMKSNEILINVK